jgi:hypothetical protein
MKIDERLANMIMTAGRTNASYKHEAPKVVDEKNHVHLINFLPLGKPDAHTA